jgi:hypothetical protein
MASPRSDALVPHEAVVLCIIIVRGFNRIHLKKSDGRIRLEEKEADL